MKDIDRNLLISNMISCWDKKDHATKEEAIQAARDKEKRRNGAISLRVYKCLYCHKWHKTSVKETTE